jgi:hypothetical protein
VRIETQRELTDVARTLVAIENLVQALRVRRRGLDNLPSLEDEPDVVERRAEINRGGIVLDYAFH